MIGSIIGGIGSLIGGVSQSVGAANAIKQEDRNYEQRQRLMEYQKQTQQTTWEREDNAVSRRVDDLKNAGLSPVLAAGQGAASSGPVAIKAPVRDTGPTERAGTIGRNVAESFANIAQTIAQSDYLKSQTSFQKMKNEVQGATLDDQKMKIKYDTQTAGAAAAVAQGTVDQKIQMGFAQLVQIKQKTGQDFNMFQHQIKRIKNENSISDLNLRHLKDTIDSRISETKIDLDIKKHELDKMQKLLEAVVGEAVSRSILLGLQVEDFRELSPAQKEKRKRFWNNLWQMFRTIGIFK